MSKTTGTTTTSYVQDPSGTLPSVLTETTGANTDTYTYGLNMLSRAEPGPSTYYYLYDALGSVTNLTDATGSSVASYSYKAFGELTGSTGTSTNPFKFTGEQTDPETGLYYLRARSYAPWLGRFVSRDRIAGNNHSPQNLNAYVYCCDRPGALIDRSGNCGEYSGSLEWGGQVYSWNFTAPRPGNEWLSALNNSYAYAGPFFDMACPYCQVLDFAGGAYQLYNIYTYGEQGIQEAPQAGSSLLDVADPGPRGEAALQNISEHGNPVYNDVLNTFLGMF